MKLQDDDYSCGAIAFANAMVVFGKNISGKTAKRLCKTTSEGTWETNIVEAFKAYGIDTKSFVETDAHLAWRILYSSVLVGHPVIIATQNWQHYECAIGCTGKKIIVFDSSREQTKTNGVKVLTPRKLISMWRSEHGFYGIIALKK